MHRAANISSHVVTSAVSGTINDTTTLRDGVSGSAAPALRATAAAATAAAAAMR
jgi:hypothetical protein